MLKTIRDNLKDLTKDKAMRELSLSILGLMQNIVTLEEAVALLKIWCIVFLSKILADTVKEAVAWMNKAISGASLEDFNTFDNSFLCDGSKSRLHIKYTLGRQLGVDHLKKQNPGFGYARK